MNSVSSLKPGDVLSNSQIQKTFQCGLMGGMRRSKRTNSLVIVSDHTRGIYEDRWLGDTLFYTGMGLKGDQKLDAQQNRTLNEADRLGIQVHLFEVFEAAKYTYQGQVEVVAKPFQEQQLDVDDRLRSVWIFPLKAQSHSIFVKKEDIDHLQRSVSKKIKKYSDDEILERLKASECKEGYRQVISKQYQRNYFVAELARRRASGRCELCEALAPFKTGKKEPYLEVHHIVWLARGGPDTIENTVALCPNCHRKMHILGLEVDINKLKAKIGTFPKVPG